jgi:CrcB protein
MNLHLNLHPVMAVLLVGAGGGIGSILRYLLTFIFKPVVQGWPWATFAANLSGALVMGMAVFWLERKFGNSEIFRLFVMVGILGGFTTFSSFSLEMWRFSVAGQGWLCLLYAVLSVLGCVLALAAGFALAARL